MSKDRSLRRPSSALSPPPASGGWTEGDLPGDRKFATVCEGRCFALEGGMRLPEISLAYETWGMLDATASNAILVCHALTGDSHAAGRSGPAHASAGWWQEMIGPGKALDTDRYFVVCINVIGGCQGSTGPGSINPETGKPYGADFPVVSVRDIVRTQAMLATQLGIDVWLSVVGGSMGGMQAVEWGVMFPERVRSLGLIATAAAASPLQIAWSEVGRLAIANDSQVERRRLLRRGAGRRTPRGSHAGSTGCADSLPKRPVPGEPILPQHGRLTGLVLPLGSFPDRELPRSPRAQTGSPVRCQLLHGPEQDHGPPRHRPRPGWGCRRRSDAVRCPSLVVSVNSDMLYTPRLQEELRDGLVANGLPVEFKIIDSIHGHDAFLIEFDQLGPMVEDFVADQYKSL